MGTSCEYRSMYHTLSRLKTGGGAEHLCTVSSATLVMRSSASIDGQRLLEGHLPPRLRMRTVDRFGLGGALLPQPDREHHQGPYR
jgi:hypothetical protein